MNRKHLIHGASPKAARTPHHQPQERQWSGIPIAKPKLARRDHRTQTLNEAKKKKKTVCCRSLIKTFAQFSCLPSVSLARQDTEKQKSNQPHTHDRSRQKKKSHDASFPKQSSEDERPPTCSHHFTAVLPPSCCPLLSPPQHHPENGTPLSSPPTTQSRRTARPNTSQHPNAKNQASHEKKEEGVVSIYSFREKKTENRKRRKNQRGIDVRKTTRDGYIYSNNRSNKQQHQHQVEEVVTKRTTQNSHLHLPFLFPVLSPFPRSIRPRLPEYTEKEIFSLQK